MKKTFFLSSLVLLFLLSSCTKPNPLNAGEWYCVTGDRSLVSVSLPSQPQTGYVWKYELEGEACRKDTDYLKLGNYESSLGVSSAWMATFSGYREGEGTLRFTYYEKAKPENVAFSGYLKIETDKKKRMNVTEVGGDKLPYVLDHDD